MRKEGRLDKVNHVEDTFKTMKNTLCNGIINLANYTLGNTELESFGVQKQPFEAGLFNWITFIK